MKKAKFLIIILVLAFGCSLMAHTCTPVEDVDKIVVDTTSIETQYLIGEPLDFSRIKVTSYKDGVESAVKFADLTFSDFSTAEAGDFKLTVSYGEFSDTVDLKVHTPQRGVNLDVLSFEEPEQLVAYKESIKEKSVKRNEFMDRQDGYYVGTDSDYVLKPRVMAEKSIGTKSYTFTYKAYPSLITVEKKSGSNFIELSGTALTDMVAVNAAAGTFRFSAAAKGETFKLTIAVAADEENPYLNGNFSHTVTIIDGYNAHNVAEFSAVDNENKDGAWTDYKTANNIPMPASPYKAVILHDDIKIKKSDLPASYFWTEGADADGSLLDYTSIYGRRIKENEHFDLIGNYHSVDARDIPVITRDNNEGEKASDTNNVTVVSNANLFHFYSFSATDRGSVTMKNFNIIGNAPRSNDKKYSGGLTMMHSDVLRFDAYNNIATRFITMYNAMNDSTERENVLKITKTKSYDSFNSIIYVYNASYVYVEQSELIGSGCPVIIISNPYGDHADDVFKNRVPRLIIDKFSDSTADGSIIETQVSGQETWFQINGASTIAAMLGALSSGIETMSQQVSAGIAAATGGQVLMPVRSFHKVESGTTLFNPRVLIYPDSLDKNFYTKGEVYEGSENATHNAEDWNILLKMEEMTSLPSSESIEALGGMSQKDLVGAGSPYITSRGGSVNDFLQAGLGLPAVMPAGGISVFQNAQATDFVFKNMLTAGLATASPADYLGFFLGDHISIYNPIVHRPVEDNTPHPTSIGLLLEYYSSPYTPA